MDGIINLDKPPGITSARAVSRAKRLLPRGIKIGHAGTLDPFATGVLLLLIGNATKSCETLMSQPKTYQATVKLGATTPTDDLESAETPMPNPPSPTLDQIRDALRSFIGVVPQRPPDFSAIKVAGRRAFDLARRGRPVHLPPRDIRINAIEILAWQWPLLNLRIDCGRGAYIRSIARDLGQILHTGGYLTELRRLRIGPFHVDRAVTLDCLVHDGIQPHLQPIPNQVPALPSSPDELP